MELDRMLPGSQRRWLSLIFLLAALLLSYGIWVVEPWIMGPDEKSAVTKALWLGVHRTPFLPDFTKGGKFYVYFLAAWFAPVYLYLLLTGRTEGLSAQATRTSNFFDAPPELQRAFYDFVVVGRVASVVVGLLTIYFTYLIGRRLYGCRNGVLAAGILTVSMAFVNTSHMATEDTLLTCLVSLVFVLFAYYYQTDDERYLWLASVVAGLAVSTKMTAGFLVVPLVYVLSWEQGVRAKRGDRQAMLVGVGRLVKGGILSLSAYLVTTPAIFVYPGLYVAELLGESSLAFSPGTVDLPGWVLFVFHTGRAFGLPLFLLVIAGLFLVGRRIFIGRGTHLEMAFFLFLVPYFIVVGSWQTTEVWYVVPLMPMFAVFAADTLEAFFEQVSTRRASPFLVGVLIFSSVYTGVTVGQIGTDARIESTEWLEDQVSAGDVIDTHVYPLQLPAFPDRAKVNRYWFNTSKDRSFDLARERITCGVPKFVVLSSSHYGMFIRNPEFDPTATAFYQDLLAGDMGYQVVATFGPSLPPPDSITYRLRLTVVPETITNHNLRIVVLKRSGTADGKCPT